MSLIEHLKVERLEKLEGRSILQVVFHSFTIRKLGVDKRRTDGGRRTAEHFTTYDYYRN
jgi:hypothetical protein